MRLSRAAIDAELGGIDPPAEFFPVSALLLVQTELAAAGVPVGRLDVASGADAVLLAEAVNWAAKALDERFYALKAGAFCAAAMRPGVESGWDTDGCFYLCADGAGEVCAHDPFGDIWTLAEQLGLTNPWPHGWCGIRRQHAAFVALVSPAARRVLDVATRTRCWTDAQVARILRRLAGER